MSGRPTSYSEQILEDSWNYVKEFANDSGKGDTFKVQLPSIEGLALYLEISRSTLYLWQQEHKEFSDIIEVLQQKQAQVLINNGLSGAYNPTIAKVLLTKHGYTDKTEVNQKTTFKDERIDPSKLTDDELRSLAEMQRKSGISEA
jgi:hypothetical protein